MAADFSEVSRSRWNEEDELRIREGLGPAVDILRIAVDVAPEDVFERRQLASRRAVLGT